jgi:tetratricopeptide (TPR) repeat protein
VPRFIAAVLCSLACASLSLPVLLLLPGGARAQQPDEAAARRSVEESMALYEDGEFHAAAALLRRAYRLYPEPVILFNLGRSLEDAGEPAEAADAYEAYLAAAESVSDQGAIEARITRLREQAAGVQVEPSELDASPPPLPMPAQHVAPSRLGATVLLTAGAAAAVGGLAVFLAGRGPLQDVADAGSLAEARDLQADGLRRQRVGAACLVLGVAVAATGGVLLWSSHEDDDEPASVEVALSPTHVWVRGSF